MYDLTSFENNRFKVIRELTEEEFQKTNGSASTIKKINIQFLVYIYFQLNLLEFDKLAKSLTGIPVGKLNINFIQSNTLYIQINRTVFNLLGSFKFFH